MIDREKVIKGLEHLSEWLFNQYCVTYDGDATNYYNTYKTVEDALDLLKEQNNCENCAIAIEDRQPVIRCKDCQFYTEGSNEIDSWMRCKLHSMNSSPDEFCSWAVKRK